jgi:DNA-binding MarR family transcriptional regulator
MIPSMSGAASDSEVPWLDAGQLEDWKAIVALLMIVPAALDAQLRRDSELNIFEYQVLAALSEAPARTIAMSELALLSQGSLSRLSHAVTRLERAGAVERRVCSSAGRRIEVRLTDLGWRTIQQAAPGHVREVRRLLVDALTAEQLRQLGDAARAAVAGTNPALAALLVTDRD